MNLQLSASRILEQERLWTNSCEQFLGKECRYVNLELSASRILEQERLWTSPTLSAEVYLILAFQP